jgi:hypothetical protein
MAAEVVRSERKVLGDDAMRPVGMQRHSGDENGQRQPDGRLIEEPGRESESIRALQESIPFTGEVRR